MRRYSPLVTALSVVSVAALSLSLSACGSSAAGDAPGTPEPSGPASTAGRGASTTPSTESSTAPVTLPSSTAAPFSDESGPLLGDDSTLPPPAPEAAPAGFTNPVRTDSIFLETSDGYQADLKVTWYAPHIIEGYDLEPECYDLVASKQIIPGTQLVPEHTYFRVVDAEVTAEFLESNGFAWPAGEGFRVTSENAGPLDAITACGGIDLSSGHAQISMTPDNPTLAVRFVKPEERTPKDPEVNDAPLDDIGFTTQGAGCSKDGGALKAECASWF